MHTTGVLEFDDTLQFIDEKGHTPKSQGEYDKHKNLAKLREISKAEGDKHRYVLTEKPITIINKSFYDNLEEIVEQSLRCGKIWVIGATRYSTDQLHIQQSKAF